jgi:hypothetical protein
VGLVVVLGPSASWAEDAGAPFGELPLVDEIVVGSSDADHSFTERPSGASEVQTILGKPTRVIPNQGGPRYFAYKIGEGANLEAGKAYVLAIEFPEDAPRTVYVINRGAETNRGFSTGQALGDAARGYTNQNLESVDYPLSGESRWWRGFFYLNDRFMGISSDDDGKSRPHTPDDGFWVIIAQPGQWKSQNGDARQAPKSAGAALSRIRLFEVSEPASHFTTINYPEDLPRRHLFWREEMADAVVHVDENNTLGVDPTTKWYRYKAEQMRFLGMNTFSKDLLEFGHNQGWQSDYKDYGGYKWYWRNDEPERWSNIIDMLGDYDHYVLPYYEYNGSRGQDGLGDERRCRPLTKDGPYTHIGWSEDACVNVSDPDFVDDATALLDTTILQYADRAKFLGAWFRTRPSQIPISFTDADLGRFGDARGMDSVSRASLQADQDLLDDYYAWWFEQRQQWLVALRDYLQAEAGEEMKLFFTAYNAEQGPGVSADIVTDDVAAWNDLGFEDALTHQDVYQQDMYAQRLIAYHGTWGQWEWQHSLPPPDPQNYDDVDDIMFTHPINRLYTVSDSDSFDMMRTPGGLALTYHYPLNEDTMTTSDGEELTNYFVADVERAGPYSMLPEARALAYGDPRYIGYLTGSNFVRGFPLYVRNFNLAFLSLPAVSSQIVTDATTSDSVVVRRYDTTDPTYFAIVNTGLETAKDVRISLPEGRLIDAVTDQPVSRSDGDLRLELYPGQVRSIKVTSDPQGPDSDAGHSRDAGGDDIGVSADVSGDASKDTTSDSEGCSCSSASDGTPMLPAWLIALCGVAFFARLRRLPRTP